MYVLSNYISNFLQTLEEQHLLVSCRLVNFGSTSKGKKKKVTDNTFHHFLSGEHLSPCFPGKDRKFLGRLIRGANCIFINGPARFPQQWSCQACSSPGLICASRCALRAGAHQKEKVNFIK